LTTTAPYKGLDGRRDIVAAVQLPSTEARLIVSLDEREVFSRIDREIGIAYVQLVLFGMIILLAAWFGGERLVVEPIRAAFYLTRRSRRRSRSRKDCAAI
jgi:hypothetical protein